MWLLLPSFRLCEDPVPQGYRRDSGGHHRCRTCWWNVPFTEVWLWRERWKVAMGIHIPPTNSHWFFDHLGTRYVVILNHGKSWFWLPIDHHIWPSSHTSTMLVVNIRPLITSVHANKTHEMTPCYDGGCDAHWPVSPINEFISGERVWSPQCSWTRTLLGGVWTVHNFCETCATSVKRAQLLGNVHNISDTCTTSLTRAQHLWYVHNISETFTYRILENTGWGRWNISRLNGDRGWLTTRIITRSS